MPDWLGNVINYIAIAICVGFSAIGCGIGEGKIASLNASGSMRQPAASQDLSFTALISMAVSESASIFGLVVGLILLFRVGTPWTIEKVAARLGAGLAMGLAGAWAGYGAACVGEGAIEGLTRRPSAKQAITLTALVAQAVSQSPAVFALLIALILIFQPATGNNIIKASAFLSSGLCIGLGCAGPSLGAGKAGKKGCLGIARNLKNAPTIMRLMLLGQAVCQSTAVYALVIAMSLILFIGK